MDNKFSSSFGRYACPGDTIVAEIDGFTIKARIVHDDFAGKPEDNDEGFWPSKDPKAAGYVEPEMYDIAMAKAEEAMAAWKNNQWYYCGVVLSVSKRVTIPHYTSFEVELAASAASLWGIECNYDYPGYPDSDNSYLTEVANELLPEALDVVKHIVAKLKDSTVV